MGVPAAIIQLIIGQPLISCPRLLPGTADTQSHRGFRVIPWVKLAILIPRNGTALALLSENEIDRPVKRVSRKNVWTSDKTFLCC